MYGSESRTLKNIKNNNNINYMLFLINWKMKNKNLKLTSENDGQLWFVVIYHTCICFLDQIYTLNTLSLR